MSLLQNSNAISTGGGYNLESSLRFRASASAYLSRTFGTPTNNLKWTWSGWVKLGLLSNSGYGRCLFAGGAADSGNNLTGVFYTTANKLALVAYSGGASQASPTTNAVYRDTSSWYHVVCVYDSANATQADRFIFYVNGTRQTVTGTLLPLNLASKNNANGVLNRIGMEDFGTTYGFDGYMTEVNFVDGQALTPSDFGETDTITGVWKPKEYTGTYGTNGFYLPMKETQQATGFNTVLYTGTGAAQTIDNVGFSPDLVWIKKRNTTGNHTLVDTVRGTTNNLVTNSTNNEGSWSSVTAFNNNGFTLGTDGNENGSGATFAAWCWDAGSSTVSNTDGTITSNVRANPATGFSVVTYTGTGANATVGHGLSSAPKMVIVKDRSTATSNWIVYHTNMDSTPSTAYLYLNLTNAVGTGYSGYWNSTSPSSSVVSIGTHPDINTSSNNYVAYCFSEVSGFSKFGSYTGNGSTSGPTVTTGFRPAFVMIKSTTTAGSNWWLADNTRDVSNPNNALLFPNLSNAEYTTAGVEIDFNDTGFQLKTSSPDGNKSGDTFIYMAFADTRDNQWNFDASGNKNNWTPNNINSNASSETTYDLMSDTPSLADEDTGNFCTWNPLVSPNATYSNGNLRFAGTTFNNVWISPTIGVSSGKFYWEYTVEAISSTILHLGITQLNGAITEAALIARTYYGDGTKYSFQTGTITGSSFGSSYAVNDIIQVALDMDSGKVWFGKNNTWQASGDPSAGTNEAYSGLSGTFGPFAGKDAAGNQPTVVLNCGQRPFAYTPPTGFKKLNTYNLPDSTIKDGSQYFNPVLYTGIGSALTVSGVGFSPDAVWIKRRDVSSNNRLQGSYAANTTLITNSNASEGVVSFGFTSDGFTTGTINADFNASGGSYVAWNWRASDSSPVSNTDGTITSTVSANTTSGFSVVTYTGSSSGISVGHGLSSAPEMIIWKARGTPNGSARHWIVWHKDLTNTDYILYLSLTNAQTNVAAGSVLASSPTSTTFSLGTEPSVNWNSENYVSYCFTGVEGFSKFGSYTGNGSTDGPFVFTNFRPAFILTKKTDATSNWQILDNTRTPANDGGRELLRANTSDAEIADSNPVDFLSNGFKQRSADGSVNGSGNTYIYMCFAQNPFKGSLAR